MRTSLLIVISSLFLLGNYYLAKKIIFLLQQVMIVNKPSVIIVFVLILGMSSLLSFILADRNVGSSIGKIGNYWLGFFLTSLVIFGLTELIYRLLEKFTPIAETSKGTVFFLAFAGILLFYSYGVWHAQQIKTTKYEVILDKKQAKEQKLRVVLITDLHLGYINGEKKIEKIVTKINKLQPDIVLISGDLFDGNYYALQQPNRVAQKFQQLSSTHGSYLCWGNHDAGTTFEQMKQFTQKANINILEDQSIEIEDTAFLVGRKDIHPIGNQGEKRHEIKNTWEKATKKLPIIIMDHQPSTIDQYDEKVDLIVSGHTHQGQIFPFNFVTKAYFTVDYGYYQKATDQPQVIVSSGVGTWGPPMRVATQNEIVQIDLMIE